MRRLIVAFVSACVPVLLAAQVPSRSVNMVSGTDWPGGDPFLQRQNEPAIAASTRNPLHLVAGANDYRTVDLPGLPNSGEVGDAWMGLFKSFNGGATWKSTLLPGYPQDTSPEGTASPLKAYTAAADPVVRAGTNGLIYYSGIVFDRTTPSKSGMFVARLIDNNNKEAGDPIIYLGTSLVATNPGTEFIDKPWMAVDVPRSGATTCSFTTTQPNPTPTDPNATITVEQSFAGGAVYVVYSLISGEGTSTRSQVYFSRSLDCGVTWSASQRISSLDDPVNQGATLAIDPRTGSVYIAWRRFSADGTDDTIMVARSIDQGRKWDPPGRARRFPRGKKIGLQPEMHGKKFSRPVELSDLTSLDQPTFEDRFRTNAYPTMTIDDQGRVYVAWSERGFSPWNPDPDDGDARILVASSTNVTTWTDPVPIDNGMLAGHQVMPAMAFAGGKLMVAYYDFREDEANVFSKWIDEFTALWVVGSDGQIYPRANRRRHTVDVRAAMAAPGAALSFGPSVQVSDYLFGSRPGVTSGPPEQLQFNPPNLKMFKLGTVPFFGDYIDLAPSPAFVPVQGGWAFNTAPSSTPLFHAVWTDNRDVVPPVDGNWTNYTPPSTAPGQQSKVDPNQLVPQCVAGRDGMRNQNIYTARLTGGLIAGSPGNSKDLDPLLQRSFAVYAQNLTYLVKTFRLTIENQPPGGRASFSQYPLPPYDASSAPPLTTLEVIVSPRSTIARSVFATSSEPRAQIHVSVVEIAAVNGPVVAGGLETTVVLNPDIANPEISNPEISNPEISNPEISNAEVYNPEISNPEISNPEISNPEISNPDIANPEISNPEISNVQVANPDIANPDIANPEISNPEISNPEISNPEISNPDIANQSLTDTTWTVTNDGNTATAYSIKLLLADPSTTIDPNAIVVQLILRQVYTTPVSTNCTLGLHATNVLLANILNPEFSTFEDVANPDIANPEISNATLWLAPGETAKVTIRTFDKNIHDNITFDAATAIIPVIVAQSVNTADLATPGAVPPIAYPSSPNLTFIEQPTTGSTNAPLGAVRTRVTDDTGAPLPAIGPVMLDVYLMPNAATPVRTLASVTNVDGIATFDIGTFTAPGTYRMKASVTVGEDDVFTWSEAFVLTEPPPVTFFVTTTADSGTGTLRQAILDAEENGVSRDVISFNIPPGGPFDVLFTIALQSPLPTIDEPIVIDGTTQPGYAGVPNVYIDGTSAGATSGLRLWGPNSEVRGLGIVGFQEAGILIGGGTGSRVRASYIGIAPDGGAAANGRGIEVSTDDNVIGGAAVADRNVISGNTGFGVTVLGGIDVSGNRIVGNYIGTNPAGTAAVPNGGGGVSLNAPTTVGGVNPGEGNLISGNGGVAGIRLFNDDNESIIQGNLIGTNAAGDAAVPNAGYGIYITDTEDSLIGGTAPGARNVISGNAFTGIRLAGDASATTIHGNYIGLNAAGTAAIGNGVGNGASGVTIDNTFSTQLGGPSAAERNVISGNGGHGVELIDGVNNRIEGNYIGTNAAGTADLGNQLNGVTLAGESRQNTIGAVGAGNVVSGNNTNGILVSDTSHDNAVLGNLVGTNAAGTSAIGNGSLNEFLDLVGAGVYLLGFNNEVAGNVISGNGTGIVISGTLAADNIIRGNKVGTNAAGTAAVRNRFGIFNGGAPRTLIGGTDPTHRNVISGNQLQGIYVTGESAVDVQIVGNRIGTNDAGTAALSNTFAGITVESAARVIVGGDTAASANLISGNNGSGIRLETAGNTVKANNIGVDGSFENPLPNGGAGISITGPGNTVDLNVIMFNTGAGISATGAGNAFLQNKISQNGGLGIDQGGDGVTGNDATETDGVQNFPVLTLAETNGATIRLVGSLNSTPSTAFEIRFSVNPSCDASGNGEGDLQFASSVFNTNTDGVLTFDVIVGLGLAPGQSVTATARNTTTNDTSEFSACITVTPGGLDPEAEPAPVAADDASVEEDRSARFELPATLSRPRAIA